MEDSQKSTEQQPHYYITLYQQSKPAPWKQPTNVGCILGAVTLFNLVTVAYLGIQNFALKKQNNDLYYATQQDQDCIDTQSAIIEVQSATIADLESKLTTRQERY